MTRKEILERVSDLQHREQRRGIEEPRNSDLPPAYGDVANYNDLAAALDEIAEDCGTSSAAANPLPMNAREVFSIPEDVQIYFISAQDNVSAPSYPSFLRLVQIESRKELLFIIN